MQRRGGVETAHVENEVGHSGDDDRDDAENDVDHEVPHCGLVRRVVAPVGHPPVVDGAHHLGEDEHGEDRDHHHRATRRREVQRVHGALHLTLHTRLLRRQTTVLLLRWRCCGRFVLLLLQRRQLDGRLLLLLLAALLLLRLLLRRQQASQHAPLLGTHLIEGSRVLYSPLLQHDHVVTDGQVLQRVRHQHHALLLQQTLHALAEDVLAHVRVHRRQRVVQQVAMA